MASNSLNGPIPCSLHYLTTLTTLDLLGNQLSGEIPASLSQIKLNLLDLSNNTLSGPIPDSLSIDAYNDSFAGNSRLCSRTIKFFRRCSPESQNSRFIHPILIPLFALSITVLLSLACFFYLKKSRERSLTDESWDLVSFRPLTFTKKEILDAIKQENIIGEDRSDSVGRRGIFGSQSHKYPSLKNDLKSMWEDQIRTEGV